MLKPCHCLTGRELSLAFRVKGDAIAAAESHFDLEHSIIQKMDGRQAPQIQSAVAKPGSVTIITQL